jgi:hypothetical protein
MRAKFEGTEKVLSIKEAVLQVNGGPENRLYESALHHTCPNTAKKSYFSVPSNFALIFLFG